MTIVQSARVFAAVCLVSLLNPSLVSAQSDQPQPGSGALIDRATDTGPAAHAESPLSVVDTSFGLALIGTSCYQLAEGGRICHGSLAGEAASGCGLRGGCHVSYGALAFSLGWYVTRRLAIAGEVAFAEQVELEPSDSAASAVVGPRFRLWRAFTQVLVGHQWHSVFQDGLLVQPGIGIDLGGAMGTRLQADYAYFEPLSELSGFRFHVAFVAHLGEWRPR